MERLGFSRVAIMDALKGRHQNKAAVAYYLLLDSRRRAAGSGSYLRAELSGECEALLQNPLGNQHPSPPPPTPFRTHSHSPKHTHPTPLDPIGTPLCAVLLQVHSDPSS